jgi:DNA-binding SARP family transcriptional activator
MGIAIRLIGRPRIDIDGAQARSPRGRKAWGLLAYLLLSHTPPTRHHLADLLFADADDPLAALRWNLAELRRALLQRQAFRGDPVKTDLNVDTQLDVIQLTTAGADVIQRLDIPRGELLDGLSWSGCPAFESWLLAERRCVAMALEAVLRERALLEIVSGDLNAAQRTAAQLIAMNPYDAGHHELLIRSLLAAGNLGDAIRQVKASEAVFRDDLGIEPPRHLGSLVARHRELYGNSRVGAAGVAAARARLTAGRAALTAGAADTGLDALRRAIHDVDAHRDAQLRATILLALGGGLVHTMRCHEEAATVLHEAAALAEQTGDRSTAAQAYREIGFIDTQAGRRQRARHWLDRAEQAADGFANISASVHAVQGMERSDAAQYSAAMDRLETAIAEARSAQADQPLALALSLRGRVCLLTGDDDGARSALHDSLATVEAAQWIAFRPWPEVLLAETELRDGRSNAARDRLDHAFALACELDDPCWSAAAARGLGVLEYCRGHRDAAMSWLEDARARCVGPVSPYQWLHAWILQALVTVAREQNTEAAERWAGELEVLSARTAMRGFCRSSAGRA